MIPDYERDRALCGKNDGDDCINTFITCTSIFAELQSVVGNINIFDIRKQCEDPLCYDRMKNLELGILALLMDGIKMLIYVGVYDMKFKLLGKILLEHQIFYLW